MPGSLDFIQCKNGIDTLIYDCQKVEGWLNPEIYNTLKILKNSLAMRDTEIAYKIGESYLMIQTAEEGYDYTFFDKNYLELDGGIYDDPDISITEAIDEILQEEGFSTDDAEVTDYEALELKTEHAEKENIEQVLMELNCPKSIFEGYDRDTAMETYEGITVQFAVTKNYLTVQPTNEGYSYIFYDADLKEVGEGTHEYLDDSIQEATYAILKKEGMQKEQCIKVDDSKFRDKLIQNAKELLENGTVRRT